jgi:hypothetical protein
MFKTSGKERATNHAPSVVMRAVPSLRAISAHVPPARDIARAVIIDMPYQSAVVSTFQRFDFRASRLVILEVPSIDAISRDTAPSVCYLDDERSSAGLSDGCDLPPSFFVCGLSEAMGRSLLFMLQLFASYSKS